MNLKTLMLQMKCKKDYILGFDFRFRFYVSNAKYKFYMQVTSSALAQEIFRFQIFRHHKSIIYHNKCLMMYYLVNN